MTSPDTPPPQNLKDQVASADAAVRQDAAREAAKPRETVPVDRRMIAAFALLALIATIWLSMDKLNRPVLTAEQQRTAMEDGLEYLGGLVQQYEDSTGKVLTSVSELGLGELPVVLTRTTNGVRLAGITEAGDSVFYLSPVRPAPEAR